MNEPGAHNANKPFHPLNRRVVAWALLFSALFTLAMTAILIAIDYRDQREEAFDQLRFAAASYRKSMANSLWDLDMEAVRLQVDGLASFPMVGHVVLTTRLGQTVQGRKHGAAGHGLPDDLQGQPDALFWEETLSSPHDPAQVVGQLRLYADRAAVLRRVESGAVRILAGEAVKGLALGLLIAWLIARLVTRHLSQMAAQVSQLRPTALGKGLALQRGERRHVDELDQLCGAFNLLNARLVEYIDAQRTLEDELREHRDRLSGLVSERTRSLERLRGFHNLIIRVLTRFISQPPGQAKDAIEDGLAAFADHFGAICCLLYTYEKDARGFSLAHAWPPQSGAIAAFLPDEGLPHSLLAERASQVWLVASSATGADQPLLALLAADAYTAVSVELQARGRAMLCLVGSAIAPDSENGALLEMAARVSGNMLDHKTAQTSLLDTQVALQRANQELRALSRHDPLTALPNRRYFDEQKETEFRRALRSGAPLSVLICDIDEFKRYNDSYGHVQGDRCLQAIAAQLAPLFNRPGDLLARLGGEEFVVLLPDTDPSHAQALAQRMQQTVWDANLPHASSSVADRVTISVGVASLRPGLHKDFDALLEDADLALYRAKDGRNRIVVAE